ncbi:hypothetical protein FRC09_003105 [Ceratobasidium sp. 395]|nr:hypothetical protein FRC09_003105 [Ceratobasidium sp. 395]
MLPVVGFLMSHKPFDISRKMDAILIPLGNETSLPAGSLQYGSQGHQGDMSGRETQFHTGEEVSSGNHSTLEPQHSARGLTTQYHPGMFNQTKIATRILETFLKDDTSSERSRTNRKDKTGSGPLDFIATSGGTRYSLPPTSMLDFKPPPAPSTSVSARNSLPSRTGMFSTSLNRPDSYSNLLSRATTTAPPRELLALSLPSRDFTACEIPTLYPLGHMRYDQTTVVPQHDPENIPKLTRFLTPALGEGDYKAYLAAHATLVPIFLAAAETAEGSAERLAGVVKETRGRVRELETLRAELGKEAGILREEWLGFVSESIEPVT